MMSNLRHGFALFCFLTLHQLVLPELSAADPDSEDYDDWQYSGSMWLLTTPDGANLPEGSVVEDFPLYSNIDIMSTLGIQPEGGCHYPLAGWAKFASLIQPLIERD